MAKVIVYPPTSMILSDLVERMGHKALVVPEAVRRLVTANEIDSPPLNVTPEEPKKGLRYAAVDVPSGVRGRMALIGPIIDEAEAAIIVEDPGWLTGCAGCSRTNESVKLLIRDKRSSCAGPILSHNRCQRPRSLCRRSRPFWRVYCDSHCPAILRFGVQRHSKRD